VRCRWELLLWCRTWLQKVRCKASAASASATRSATADTHLGASLVGAPNSPVDALARECSLCSVAEGDIIPRTTVAV